MALEDVGKTLIETERRKAIQPRITNKLLEDIWKQHVMSSKLVFLAMLAAGMFAILSGLSSAYFTKFFDKYPDWVNIGGIIIAFAVVIIFVGVYRIKKEVS